MKRVLFASFLMSMTFLAACGKSSESVTPANQALNITIKYVEGPPEQFQIDVDDGVSIKKNQDTIKWKVKYVGPGSEKADVTIEDFKSKNMTNPFGNGSPEKNKFKFDPEANGGAKEADTETASKDGVFKYKITVVLPNGKMIVVDPVVIIDN